MKKAFRSKFAAFITIYASILVLLSALAMIILWIFADAYENTRPTSTMNQFLTELTVGAWDGNMGSNVDAMGHPLQTTDECLDYLKSRFNEGMSYSQIGSDSAEGTMTYSVKCGGTTFCEVTVKHSPEEKHAFGMQGWKVFSCRFDLARLCSSVEITVPSTFIASLNGVTLTQDFITVSDIHFSKLDSFYSKVEGLPMLVTYRYDNYFGVPDMQLTDVNGNPFSIDPSLDENQFIDICSDAQNEMLNDFCNRFAQKFYSYTSGVSDDPYGDFINLAWYLEQGTELYDRAALARDGLTWSHTKSFWFNSLNVNSTTCLSEGLYLCDVSASMTSSGPNGQIVTEKNFRAIVRDRNNDRRVLAMQEY